MHITQCEPVSETDLTFFITDRVLKTLNRNYQNLQ